MKPLQTYGGHAECCTLLSTVLDVNAMTTQGLTVLSLAAMSKAPKADAAVRALLEAGAVDSHSDIPSTLVSVSTGNMKALACLFPAGQCPSRKLSDLGDERSSNSKDISCLDVSRFFGNTLGMFTEIMGGDRAKATELLSSMGTPCDKARAAGECGSGMDV